MQQKGDDLIIQVDERKYYDPEKKNLLPNNDTTSIKKSKKAQKNGDDDDDDDENDDILLSDSATWKQKLLGFFFSCAFTIAACLCYKYEINYIIVLMFTSLASSASKSFIRLGSPMIRFPALIIVLVSAFVFDVYVPGYQAFAIMLSVLTGTLNRMVKAVITGKNPFR